LFDQFNPIITANQNQVKYLYEYTAAVQTSSMYCCHLFVFSDRVLHYQGLNWMKSILNLYSIAVKCKNQHISNTKNSISNTL